MMLSRKGQSWQCQVILGSDRTWYEILTDRMCLALGITFHKGMI
jgi:hypothetical protein